MRRRIKYVTFSLIPTLLLLAVAEIALRLLPVGQVMAAGLPELQEDRDLLWRLKPNLNTRLVDGQPLRTNSMGLREDEEFGPKSPGEFRTLCLGESTTYGYGGKVENTYVEVAERRLNQLAHTTRYSLINAGMPAYTSFQSLLFLKKYGLKLEPDAAVLYHEGNDYLPCGWGNLSLAQETDPECYRRLQRYGWLWWIGRLRIIRVPAYWLARRRLSVAASTRAWHAFGTRVPGIKTRLTPDQQYQVLDEFDQVCRQAGVQLIFIHPTYKATRRHDCVLTEFARQRDIPLLETFHLFSTPRGSPRPALFRDPAHPTAKGHRLIGEALADFLARQSWFRP